MSAEDFEIELLGADSAQSATEQTVAAVDEAAKVNDDPAVAEVLADAAVKADQASFRVGWLRRLLHRRFPRSSDR